MAIIIKTRNPELLLQRVCEYIDAGRIKTWSYDDEGDLTTISPQWRYKAWLHPQMPEDGETLAFGIIASRKFSMTKEIFGVYHGRFIATLLSHFDTMMTSIEATPLIDVRYDRVKE